jgi:hypothetical protein
MGSGPCSGGATEAFASSPEIAGAYPADSIREKW